MVEKVTEKEVIHDVILEKRVEVIVERVVEVPVEKIVEIPVVITIERPVFKEILIEEEIDVEMNQVEVIYEETEEDCIDDE